MADFEIPLAANVDCVEAERAIDAAIFAAGLTTTLRGTLKKYAGCIHWHVKRGRQPGTLEVTLWPQARRAWFTIQSGRKAAWIEDAMTALHEAIQRHLEAAGR